MAKRKIEEALYFEEEEVKQILMDVYCSDDHYVDWEINIDNSKTPAVIILSKHTTEVLE